MRVKSSAYGVRLPWYGELPCICWAALLEVQDTDMDINTCQCGCTRQCLTSQAIICAVYCSRWGKITPRVGQGRSQQVGGFLCLKGVYTSRRLCGRDLVTASFFFSLLGQRCWSGIMSSYRFVVLLESVPLKRFPHSFKKKKRKTKKEKRKGFL